MPKQLRFSANINTFNACADRYVLSGYGERLTTDNGTVLEVIEASPRRVRRVRIHPIAQSDELPASDD